MLLGDLFIVDNLESGDGFFKAALHVRWEHRIFEGHFPGRPVVPGACLVQLVQELAAASTRANLQLATAGPVKFMAMVRPQGNGSLHVKARIDPAGSGLRRIVAEATQAEKVCFRFTGTFRQGSDCAD